MYKMVYISFCNPVCVWMKDEKFESTGISKHGYISLFRGASLFNHLSNHFKYDASSGASCWTFSQQCLLRGPGIIIGDGYTWRILKRVFVFFVSPVYELSFIIMNAHTPDVYPRLTISVPIFLSETYCFIKNLDLSPFL